MEGRLVKGYNKVKPFLSPSQELFKASSRAALIQFASFGPPRPYSPLQLSSQEMSCLTHLTDKETEAYKEKAVAPDHKPRFFSSHMIPLCVPQLDARSLWLQSREKSTLKEPWSLYFDRQKDSLRRLESQEGTDVHESAIRSSFIYSKTLDVPLF